MIWARPSLTILGIDCPAIAGASASIQPQARALVSLRVPPGMDARSAQQALITHLKTVALWHVEVDCEPGFVGQPFSGSVGGAAFEAMAAAMQSVYGREVGLQGSGGSIPLCNGFQETFPAAEIMLLGVEEPQCLIHAPNESVDPHEIESMALVEALFLQSYGTGRFTA
jgi:acetylornithine deacetylase/succinyl-diaminopimelate desuccinylase-like protein